MTIVPRSVKAFSRQILAGFVDELLSWRPLVLTRCLVVAGCAAAYLSEANAWLITIGELTPARLKAPACSRVAIVRSLQFISFSKPSNRVDRHQVGYRQADSRTPIPSAARATRH